MPTARTEMRPSTFFMERSASKGLTRDYDRVNHRTTRSKTQALLTTRMFPDPSATKLRGWAHVPEKGRRRYDRRARQIAFAADAHPILPVAVERRNRTLAACERVGPLPEARPAPGLANLAADRSEHSAIEWLPSRGSGARFGGRPDPTRGTRRMDARSWVAPA